MHLILIMKIIQTVPVRPQPTTDLKPQRLEHATKKILQLRVNHGYRSFSPYFNNEILSSM